MPLLSNPFGYEVRRRQMIRKPIQVGSFLGKHQSMNSLAFQGCHGHQKSGRHSCPPRQQWPKQQQRKALEFADIKLCFGTNDFILKYIRKYLNARRSSQPQPFYSDISRRMRFSWPDGVVRYWDTGNILAAAKISKFSKLLIINQKRKSLNFKF
jgi:hypothetical protein